MFFVIATAVQAQVHAGPPVPMNLDVPLGGWGMNPVPFELPTTGGSILRTEPRAEAPVAFRPRRGEKFIALRQSLRVIRPWLIVAHDSLTIQTIGGPQKLVAGDTLYGLGANYVWYRGRQDTLQNGFVYPPDARLRFICTQRITLWLEFQGKNGQTGWLEHAVIGPCRPNRGSQGAL